MRLKEIQFTQPLSQFTQSLSQSCLSYIQLIIYPVLVPVNVVKLFQVHILPLSYLLSQFTSSLTWILSHIHSHLLRYEVPDDDISSWPWVHQKNIGISCFTHGKSIPATIIQRVRRSHDDHVIVMWLTHGSLMCWHSILKCTVIECIGREAR